MFCAGHQCFRHGLIDRLFEDLSNTVSIRSKQDGFAVWRPGRWDIFILVESESLVRMNTSAVRSQPSYVHARQPVPPEQDHCLPIGASTDMRDPPVASRDALRMRGNVLRLRPHRDNPQARVLLLLGGPKRINEAAIG